MMVAYVAGSLIALTLLIASVWRVASRRRSLPCPTWLRWLVELDNPFTEVNRARVIAEGLDLRPGMQVLDAGCGPGRLTIPIAERIAPDGEIVAMDVQPGMLSRVLQKARTASVSNVRTLEAGVGDGKLKREQFDRALLVTVLGEIPNQEAAVQEVFDALKPGGLLSVTEVIFDPHFQSRATVRRLATAAGFGEKACFGGRFAFTLILEKPSSCIGT